MNEFRSRVFGGKNEPSGPLLPGKAPSGANAESGLQTIIVSRSESRTSDTRYGDRHPLPDESVTITHGGKKREVRLVNLSGGGAMISRNFEPMLWDRVDLHLVDRKLECVVQWIKDDRIGLEFAQETLLDCPAAERDAILREVIARSFPEVAALELEPEAPPAVDEVPAADEAAEDHQRSESRHPLIWSAVIHFNYDSTPARLRNISSQGALIECPESVPEGAELLLDLGDAGSLFATVSWTVGDQIGLHFKQPFDMQLLARSRPEVASEKWEAPTYLGTAVSRSPLEDPWRRLSVSELSSQLDGFLKR